MVEPRIVLADNTGLFTLDGTRTFVLGARWVAVIDPGPDDPMHLHRVEKAVRGAEGGVILLTHGHSDHSAAAALLSERTGFEVAGAGADLPRVLGDGDRIRVDDGWVAAIPTPGHARDHLAYLHGGDFFAGDLLLGRGSTTWVGEYSGCLRDYLISLDRVDRLAPRRIFPAHGPVLEHPRDAVERFRRHRLDRLHQIRQVMVGSWWRPVLEDEGPEALADQLVGRIYGSGLEAKSRIGAWWSIRAALEYLELVPFPVSGAPTQGGRALAPDS